MTPQQAPWTAGPWSWDGFNIIAGGRELLLCGIRTPMTAGASQDEARANARLTAAAPQMAEALRLMMEGSERGERSGKWASIRIPSEAALNAADAALTAAGARP